MPLIFAPRDWLARRVPAFGALYDLDIDATQPTEDNVERLISAWQARSRPSALERLATHR